MHTDQTTRPFRIDTEHDRAQASDGHSRYGAYLVQHLDRFDDWDHDISQQAATFSRAAWEIATSPIMSPGYVTWGWDRIQSVHLHYNHEGTEGDALVASISLAVPPPAGLAYDRLPGRWNGWHHNRVWGRYDGPSERILATHPTILTTSNVMLPIAASLLHPPARELAGSALAPARRDALLTAEAKASVARLVELLNPRVAPLIELLDKHGGGR